MIDVVDGTGAAAAAKDRGGIAIIAIYIAQEREREFTVTLVGCCITAIVQFK